MLRARAVQRVAVHAALHAFSAPIGCGAERPVVGRSRTAGLVIGRAVVSAGRGVAARLAARPIYTDEFCRPPQSKVAWTRLYSQRSLLLLQSCSRITDCLRSCQ
jgi:hypothetical protein